MRLAQTQNKLRAALDTNLINLDAESTYPHLESATSPTELSKIDKEIKSPKWRHPSLPVPRLRLTIDIAAPRLLFPDRLWHQVSDRSSLGSSSSAGVVPPPPMPFGSTDTFDFINCGGVTCLLCDFGRFRLFNWGYLNETNQELMGTNGPSLSKKNATQKSSRKASFPPNRFYEGKNQTGLVSSRFSALYLNANIIKRTLIHS
ncbi:unnamed protein product [Protopolystoma xenopodis]|uniref:Uncharacterized protein n=1 Tax=Protopolystoma xenopodis TaxID=117903 RepID=A0A448XKD7_9PLAT|nr:unnamed protein product [Protopolystoma xenopodis]